MRRATPARAALSEKSTLVVMLLFGCVFLVFGAHAGYTEACKALAQGDRHGLMLAILGGLAFGGFGALIWVLAWGIKRVPLEADARGARWQQKKEWVSRRIEARSGSRALSAGLLAFFVTLLSAPLLWKVPKHAADAGNPLLYGLLAVLLVAAALIVRALYLTRHWQKFGGSHLELETLPGVVGGRLRCVLHLSIPITLPQGMRFRLDCVRERHTGGDSSAQTRILWQEELRVEQSAFRLGPKGSSVPVEFTIPYTSAPTDESDPRDKILWHLSASAPVAGIDYGASFEVPVFKTEESSEELSNDGEPVRVLDASAGMGMAFPGSKIRVRPYGPGGLELFFGPARNPLGASLTTLTTVGSGVLARVLAEHGAPTPVLVGAVLISVLLIWGTLALWLGATRVRAQHGRLQVRRGLLGIGRTRTYVRDQIADIKVHAGTQWIHKLYYNIKIEIEVPRKGRLGSRDPIVHRKSAGDAISERREARALAQAMKRVVGIDSLSTTDASAP